MLEPSLELVLELAARDLGAWARRLDKTFWAVESSPESKALCNEFSAFNSGLELSAEAPDELAVVDELPLEAEPLAERGL
jgi:hypothetical protein